MKQLGIGLVVMGVLLGGMTLLGLRGTNWDYLLYLVALAGILYIRLPREMAGLRTHWKLALVYAAVSSFIILFVIVRELTKLDFNFSLAISFLVTGFVLFLLQQLDEKAAPRQEPLEQ